MSLLVSSQLACDIISGYLLYELLIYLSTYSCTDGNVGKPPEQAEVTNQYRIFVDMKVVPNLLLNPFASAKLVFKYISVANYEVLKYRSRVLPISLQACQYQYNPSCLLQPSILAF